MNITPYDGINALLDVLLQNIQSILRNKLVGLYLGGSLVLGDFDKTISDIDLVAALSSDVNEREFDELKKMHEGIVVQYPEWDDRIEVCYISTDALKTVKSRTSPIVNISPGEPIHRLEANKDWLMNWYLTREKSVALFGPPPKTIIEQITKEEYLQSVKHHIISWGSWVKTMRDRYAQVAYAILTLCRALYASKHGEQVSKKQAAQWAQKELPEWSNFIGQAIVWRETRNEKSVDDTTYQKMVAFVDVIRGKMLA